MKVNIYQDDRLAENRVDIYCKEESRKIKDLVTYIRNDEQVRLVGNSNNETHVLIPKKIFYFESVDKKCFAYMNQEVFQIDSNLTELENVLADIGFVRINKSTLVNIYKIEYIKSEINMRVHTYLENGETLIISRHYKKNFQNRLESLKSRLLGEYHEAHQ